MNLQNKRVFITGATTGIGLEIARELTKAGAKVFLTGLPPLGTVQAVTAGLRATATEVYSSVMDVLDDDSILAAVDAAMKAMGGIDILINNAGIATQQKICEQNVKIAEAEMRVNYLGMFRVTQCVLPGMLAAKNGMVINVASTLAKVPAPTQANYSASKAAIVAFSSALRSEVEDEGVEVKVFIPGLTATGMTKNLKVKTPDLLTPEAVAQHMMRAISSSQTEYVTGWTYRAFVLFSRLFPEMARRSIKKFYV